MTEERDDRGERTEFGWGERGEWKQEKSKYYLSGDSYKAESNIKRTNNKERSKYNHILRRVSSDE